MSLSNDFLLKNK